MVIGQQDTEGRFFLSHSNQTCTAVASVFAQIRRFTRFACALVTGVVVLVGVSVEAAMISLMVHKGTAGQQSKNNGQTTNKQKAKHQTTNKARAHTI
jgi:hypothetical protein